MGQSEATTDLTSELRAYLEAHSPKDGVLTCLGDKTMGELLAIADRIDDRHKRLVGEVDE